MAWQQPKTNWDTHPKAIEPADMNRIEGNILAVREQNNMALRLEVVDSFPSHAPGRAIYHTGNKMAYVSDGSNWMPFASPQLTQTYMPGTTDQTITEGYHKGSIVKGDSDLIAANIKKGINLFNVSGTHEGYVCGTGELYRYGTECVPWRNGYIGTRDEEPHQERRKLETCLFFYAGYSSGATGTVYYATSSTINFTNINTLHIEYITGQRRSLNGGDNAYLRVGPGRTTTESVATLNLESRGYYADGTLDVSGLTGSYYVKVGVSGKLLTVFRIWYT